MTLGSQPTFGMAVPALRTRLLHHIVVHSKAPDRKRIADTVPHKGYHMNVSTAPGLVHLPQIENPAARVYQRLYVVRFHAQELGTITDHMYSNSKVSYYLKEAM